MRRLLSLGGAALLLAAGLPAAEAGTGGTTTRVSVSSTGAEGNGSCSGARQALSADGRLVVFTSAASTLVPGDDNGSQGAFLHDRGTGTTSFVGLSSSGELGIYGSSGPAISANGAMVGFGSGSPNLVPDDDNNALDIFVRNLKTGVTTRVSVGHEGQEGNAHAGAFSVSADGNVVAFGSHASNLVPDDANGWLDVFVRDVKAGTTTRVSVSSTGEEGNSESGKPYVSADGRYVAFESVATNLVGSLTIVWPRIYVHDRATGQTTAPVVDMSGDPDPVSANDPVLSADGRYLAYDSASANLMPGISNNKPDTFVQDLITGALVRASLTWNGGEPNNDATNPSISANGRYVVFWSSASNLVPGDTNGVQDIFLRDLVLDQTTQVSVSSTGEIANSSCRRPSISADGRAVSFDSAATNLVPNITNWPWPDVFVRSLLPSGPETYCVAQVNSLGCTPYVGFSGSPSASAGSGFHVTADQLVGDKLGLLVYSKVASNLTPFSGGLLCLQAPLRRTPAASSGGAPGMSCTGAFDFDFNAHIASGVDAGLVPGESVWAQFWSRDPGAPSTTNLTDAIAFVIGS